MILKRPYAFFIKMFKPIHILIAVLTAVLIYFENHILSFFNSYIYTTENVVGQNLKSALTPQWIFILPALIFIFSLLILGIMIRKNKPVLFYIINIFAYIIVVVVNIYTSNFLATMEEVIVDIRMVKLIHDLVLIAIIIESISFIFLTIRGMGINIKKFDFDSEISKFDISDKDKEEFELSINIDINEGRTRRKSFIRNLKYKYLENKFLINIIAIGVILVIGLSVFLIAAFGKNYSNEGTINSMTSFNYIVDDTYIVNNDFKGDKITDNYLIVVSARLQSYLPNLSLYKNDFTLKIGQTMFSPTTRFSNSLLDLGNIYNDSKLSSNYTRYLFVYEVPEKYIKTDMYFNYNDKGNIKSIKLKPKEYETEYKTITKKLGDSISFEDTLGNIEFKITDFDIQKRYLIEYDYCHTKDQCIKSKEYLVPSIDEDFDKGIIRLNVEFTNSTDLELNNFYEFFTSFGKIYYESVGLTDIQSYGFEQIKSKKTNNGNKIYIGVNEKIINAENIKLLFIIRGIVYEYELR